MKRPIWRAFVFGSLCLSLASPASPVQLDVGDWNLPPNFQGWIPLYLTANGESVKGVNFCAQLGDGTGTAPAFLDDDLLRGTPFASNHEDPLTPTIFGQLIMDQNVTLSGTASLPAAGQTGKAVWIQIDTTGAATDTTWPLIINGILASDFPPYGLFTGFVDPDGLDVLPTTNNGSITIKPITTLTWKGGNGHFSDANYVEGGKPGYCSNVVLGTPNTVVLGGDCFFNTLSVSSSCTAQIAGGAALYGTSVGIDAGATMLVGDAGIDGLGLAVGHGGTLVFDPTAVPAASSSAAAPVPEPGTLGLLAAGGLLAAAFARRFRRAAR